MKKLIVVLIIFALIFSQYYNIQAQNIYTAHVNQPDAIPIPFLCLVSTNSNNKNIVVIEGSDNEFIDYYKVYRESNAQTGQWDSIGVMGALTSGAFVDESAQPLKQSYRYKVSAVDRCGLETTASNVHKTMNLSILKSVNNTYSLIWDEYEGFAVSSYKIYRGISLNDMKLIGTTTAGNFNYNDSYSPENSIYYQVEVVAPYICKANKKKSSYYTSTFSNIASNMSLGINNTLLSNQITIRPNPTNDKTTIFVSNTNLQNYKFSLFSISGKLIITKTVKTAAFEFSKGSLPEGVYFIELSGNKNYRSKLIITK